MVSVRRAPEAERLAEAVLWGEDLGGQARWAAKKGRDRQYMQQNEIKLRFEGWRDSSVGKSAFCTSMRP